MKNIKKLLSFVVLVSIFIAAFMIPVKAEMTSNEVLVYAEDFSTSKGAWKAFPAYASEPVIEDGELKMYNRTNKWSSPSIELYNILKNCGAGTYWFQIKVKYTGIPTGDSASYKSFMTIRGNGTNSFLQESSGNYSKRISAYHILTGDSWLTLTGSIKILPTDFTTAQSTTMLLCLDELPYGDDVILYIDDIQIYRMDDNMITNGSFVNGLVGWRAWCSSGEDEIRANIISEYNIFEGHYTRIERYGSIACNVDQILASAGPGKYTLSFKIWGFYENTGEIEAVFTRGTSEYHFGIGTFDADAQGTRETVEFTFELSQEAYDKLDPKNNEVFFRLNYSGYMYKIISYFIDDVELGHHEIATSGYELDFNPSLWNWDKELVENTNCYFYAINKQTVDKNMYTAIVGNYLGGPGDYYNKFKTEDEESFSTINIGSDIDRLIKAIELDYEKYNERHGTNLIFKEIGKYEPCPAGTYKIAIVTESIQDDYHFYRQNKDGTWSHKRGISDEITIYDASGQVITDPYYADRDYSNVSVLESAIIYDIFVGYFAISPFGDIYDPDYYK